MGSWWTSAGLNAMAEPRPLIVSVRTFRTALEEALMGYTRAQLETVLPDELDLTWQPSDFSPTEADTKRSLIFGYISDRQLPALVALARRAIAECDVATDGLRALIDAHDRRSGGVPGSVKNLIFAANGPKPDLVLRDAVNNDIEIVANAENCLVYDLEVTDEGLTFRHLVDWWRQRERLASDPEVEIARSLHARLREAICDNPAELAIFDAYGRRYVEDLAAPALIPQVYLHYDPHSRWERQSQRQAGPLARQRMDFLMLPGDRRRIVIEVDGKQHYSHGDVASPKLYADMVAEDRELQLRGYEVYRFGGYEVTAAGSASMIEQFFNRLTPAGNLKR